MALPILNLPFETDDETLQKYHDFIDKCNSNPKETFAYVPFQDTPNLPGFKINSLTIDGRILYHGLGSQSGTRIQCIPIFTSLEEINPTYSKHFEIISLPISEIIKLITDDSSAQGLLIDMFTGNIVLDRNWVDTIRS